MNAIEVESIFKTFLTGPSVLYGASFAVAEGEAFGLVGASGSGKSTMLRILATLLRPSRGTAGVKGFDTERDPRAVRRSIGYVTPREAIDPRLSGLENLLVHARVRGLGRAEAREGCAIALASIGLEKRAGEPAIRYSSGARRRLDLACALLGEPAVLLLDEPGLGLDPIAREGTWASIETSRRERGLAVLLAMRSGEEAARYCRRAAYLERGRIVAEGAPAALESTYARADRR
jgi:ABC-2 type transport system ATP-binding protein